MGRNFSTKISQFYKISTHFLLGCMLTSIICGIIIVSDVGKHKDDISIPSLKRIGYPVWTSLPLLASIVLGYLTASPQDGRRFVIAKLVVDLVNILARWAMIGFSIFILVNMNSCVTMRFIPETYQGRDDMGLGVPCEVKTISRVRLEYGLFIVIMLMEGLASIILFVSCIAFCTQCVENCSCCCLADHRVVQVSYDNQVIHVGNVEEKNIFHDVDY